MLKSTTWNDVYLFNVRKDADYVLKDIKEKMGVELDLKGHGGTLSKCGEYAFNYSDFPSRTLLMLTWKEYEGKACCVEVFAVAGNYDYSDDYTDFLNVFKEKYKSFSAFIEDKCVYLFSFYEF